MIILYDGACGWCVYPQNPSNKQLLTDLVTVTIVTTGNEETSLKSAISFAAWVQELGWILEWLKHSFEQDLL